MIQAERRDIMSETIYNFERVEKKYLLTYAQYQEFLNRISPYIEEDTYSRYTICNLYFDTDSYELIRESINKPPYKEKLRLRSYGVVNKKGLVYLELKKKYDSIVYKRRISCTLQEVMDFIECGKKIKENDQIFDEISYFMKFYQPEPKVFLAYDRNAYKGKCNPDLRITFDANIRSRTYDLSLDKGDDGTPYFTDNHVLMEIKVNQALPLWLTAILSHMMIYPTSFSKYGNIYIKNIAKKIGGFAHV